MYASGKHYTKQIFLILLSIMVIAQCLLLFAMVYQKKAYAFTCPDLASYFVRKYNGTTDDILGFVSGTTYLRFYVPAVTLPNVGFYSSEVRFEATNTTQLMYNSLIGKGVKVKDDGGGAAAAIWDMKLFSNLMPPSTSDPYLVRAYIGYSDGSQTIFCPSGTTNMYVNNATTETLSVRAAKASAPTTAVTSADILANGSLGLATIVQSSLTDLPDGVENHMSVSWEPIKGTFNKSNIFNPIYYAPTFITTDNLKVCVTYAGREWPCGELAMNVQQSTVVSTTGSTPTTSTVNTTPIPTNTATASFAPTPTPIKSSPTPIPTPPKPIKSAYEVAKRDISTKEKECIIDAIGSLRLKEIVEDSKVPTSFELDRIKACFNSNNNIIPAEFAPLDENNVKVLKIAGGVKIEKIENSIKNSDGSTAKVMVISGRSEPFKTILIYIFSEPLVMTTTADADGNWSYELENPINPGEHEVYAVVNQSDGQYIRSNPWDFIIGRAEASAENPDGMSLDLTSVTPPQDRSSILTYVVIVSTVLMLALVIVAVYMIKRNKKNSLDEPTTLPIPPPSNDPVGPTTVTPSISG